LVKLLPHYCPNHDAHIEVHFGSSLGAAHDSIPTRLAQGQRFDLFILAQSALEAFSEQGHIDPTTRVDLVSSDIGAAVPLGAPIPDISTVDAFRATLLAARSVAHAASASGIYLSTEVFPALGIAEEMKRTARPIFSERVGTILARGEADLGFQQISEILPIAGVQLIGKLPQAFRRPFRFCAGIGTASAMAPQALALVRFLASEQAGPVIEATGLEPLNPPLG
jgi:molybdate transport system substrate-binding protein